MTKLSVITSRPIGDRCIAYCIEENIGLFTPNEADIVISVMCDKLIKPHELEGRRFYNFHPGVLPWYRGAGAFSWAIINGEIESGVTLHVIDKDIDHGPVIDIRRFTINPSDTAESLFKKA